MLAVFKRRKAAVNVDAATEQQDTVQALRELHEKIRRMAEGSEPDDATLDRLQKLTGKDDSYCEEQIEKIHNRRHVSDAKARIPSLVEQIRALRAEVTKGCEPWQAALVNIPEETELQERLLQIRKLPALEDDVPDFLAEAISANRSEISGLNERSEGLTTQRFNAEQMLSDARQANRANKVL